MANKKLALGCLGVIILGVIIVALAASGTYNSLVRLDQKVQAQWAQVENVYQRRADLIPNLVETVKGAADFEKSTFTAVTEARAKVGQEFWESLSSLLAGRFRKGEFTGGLVAAIGEAGTKLAAHFPYDRATDVNELPDDIDFGK
jgi:hypothetical protein